MSKYKSEDYKITAVKYYLENNTNYTKTCYILKFSERSLKIYIERYVEKRKMKILKYKNLKKIKLKKLLKRKPKNKSRLSP
jgi:hypothetical protein